MARLVLVCAVLMTPVFAAAQSDDTLAKQYYKLGEELYNRADYEGALKQFQQAYQISKKPALLYNMARCQESLGQHEKAIELLTEYLKSNPDNPELIEARIANLRRLVEKKQQEKGTVTPPPATAPVTAPTVVPPPPAVPQTDTTPPPRRSRPLRLPGWIVTGAGGALLITGIALGAMAKTKASELEDLATGGKTEYSTIKSKESTQRSFRNAAIGTLVAGGALAVTGAVLLILDARAAAASERRAWIAPAIGPQCAGLAGQLSF